MTWHALTFVLAFLAVLTPAHSQTGRPCEELADALVYKSQHLPYDPTPVPPLELIEWITTVDPTNRAQMVEVICNTAAVNASSAVAYLERTGILESTVRRAYDIGVALLQTYRPMLQAAISMGAIPPGDNSAQLGLELMDTLDEMGFFGLDPEGVQEGMGYVTVMFTSRGTTGGGKRNTRSTAACARLKSLIQQILPRVGPYMAYTIQEISGINVRDEEFGGLLCDIADSTSIADMVSALRSRNFFVNIHQTLRRQLALNGQRQIAFLTRAVNMSDDDIVSVFGVMPVMAHDMRENLRGTLRAFLAMQAMGMIPQEQ